MTMDSEPELYDATQPIVCTIEAPDVGPHVATLERLRAAVRAVERTDVGLVARLDNSDRIAADVERFVAEESRCCRFWGFDVVIDGDITLRWEGPPETQAFIDAVAAYLRGELPIGRLFGPSPLDGETATEAITGADDAQR